MKTVFNSLLVCACICILSPEVLAFVPQSSGQSFEYSVVAAPVTQTQSDQTPIVETQAHQASADCGCSASRCRNQGGVTIKDMWNREHPDGTQHGHIAYPSAGMYYYHRPYNASHYRQHRMRLRQSADMTELLIEPRFHDGFQYVNPKENHLFRSQIRSADPARDQVDAPKASGLLEFADWQRHEAAKLAWNKELEAKPAEEGTPAQLSSHAK